MIFMNKIIEKDTILYLDSKDTHVVLDINASCKVKVYHFVINSESEIYINLNHEGAEINYYYYMINYQDHRYQINVVHHKNHTISHIYNHGVNVKNNNLHFSVNGIVPKDIVHCICNQENQIINIENGKSTICPNLLIDCYDVISNHSAYIGRFKLEELFYLESRGLSRKKAYQLLLKGFLIPIEMDLKKIENFLLEIENI